MSMIKLVPSCKDYLWGGHRLVEEYHKNYDGEILAETWELSCHPDGPSYVADGPDEGVTFPEYIEKKGHQILGKNCERFEEFPMLIKFIDARGNLSIQVHPDNAYALKNEGQYGKTEMWYICDAKEGACLYYGFNREISEDEFRKRIENDTLLEVLNAVPVHKGDVFFIEAGTIHAIGQDIVIAEIQQNSNLTYRVYDYGRVGKDGKKRELHIEKALAVTKTKPAEKKFFGSHLGYSDSFVVDLLVLDGTVRKRMTGVVTEDSFESILVVEGEGTLTCQGSTRTIQKGDSWFLEAGSGEYTVEGSCIALLTTVGKDVGVK